MDPELLAAAASLLSGEGDPDEAFKKLSERLFLIDRQARLRAANHEDHEAILERHREFRNPPDEETSD